MTDASPTRVQMLHEAAALTAGDRDREYGPPAINLNCAGRLKRIIRKCATRELSPAEQEACDMLLTKISRAVTGAPKHDTFVDMAGYSAIWGEVAFGALNEAREFLPVEEQERQDYVVP